MSIVKRISENQAVEIINNIKGSPIMGITQRTFPKLLKKDRVTKDPANFEQNDIAKLTETTIKVGSEYVTRVLNELAREHKSETEYKQGINTNPIDKLVKNGILGRSQKNGKLMFEYGTLPNVKPTVKYLFNKGLIEKNNIGDILPVRKPATNQGTYKEIQIRKVYFINILDFTINGIKYLITR